MADENLLPHDAVVAGRTVPGAARLPKPTSVAAMAGLAAAAAALSPFEARVARPRVYTEGEKHRFEKGRKKRKIQKASRRRNRRK